MDREGTLRKTLKNKIKKFVQELWICTHMETRNVANKWDIRAEEKKEREKK